MSFGADRTVKVNLKATVSDYVGKITAASKATQDFGKSAVAAGKTHKQSFDQVGKTLLLSGAAIGVGVGLAVKAFADFDKELSNVRSVSGASASEMAKLSDAALQAGADTKFSATDAAKAEAELAKVGISVSDILGGALIGSLNLAAAGNIDLASAATIAGQAMKIFKLQGSDVGHIADVLAAGANASAADVSDLAQALQQGGLVAAQTGLSLDDTAGVLSAFADNALIGSDAGTSFKTMLQRLTPQSQQAADLMDNLGLSAFDASGEFIGITQYAGLLQTKLKGMSTEQRNATLQTLFGSDAIRAATVLYGLGAQGVQKYVDTVNDQGAAARTAAIQMDNLSGDIEQLKGSLDTALIKSGSAANGVLRGITQNATEAVNAFGDLPAPVQKGALVVAALAAAVLLAGGALLTMIPRVAATKAALSDLGITGGRAAAGLKAVGKAAALVGVFDVAASAIGQFAVKSDEATASVEHTTAALLDLSHTNSMAAIDKIFQGTSNIGEDNVNGFADAIDRLANPDTNQKLNNFAGSVVHALSLGGVDAGTISGEGSIKAQLDQTGQALADLVNNGQARQAGAIFDQLSTAAAKSGLSTAELLKLMPSYQDALEGQANAASSADTATTSLGGAVDGVQVSVEDATKAVDELVKSLAAAGLVQLSARDAARGYQQALDDAAGAAKKNGKTLDISTQKGRDNQAALDDVAKSALDSAQAIYENVKQTRGAEPAQAAFRTALLKSRDGLIKTGERFGLTKKQAEVYADSVLNIPAVKNTRVNLTGADAAISAAGRIAAAIAAIPGRKTTDIVVRKIGAQSDALVKPATGGLIRGPGTGTSDSIPAMISNGEYVIKAAAVSRYGASFFHQLNAMRFASGGQVQTRPSVSTGAPATVGVPSINYNGPVYLEDPNAFARKQVTAQRDAVAMFNFRGA